MRATMIRSSRKLAEFPHDPEQRGYNPVYREQQVNFCPGCGRSHWWLGRISAECVFCGTALPFAMGQFSGSSTHVRCGTSGEFIEYK
jgi:hypothetical protein